MQEGDGVFLDLLNYRIYAQNDTISHKRPVLVLIHGLGGGIPTWFFQVHELKKHYDLLLLELPSHGKCEIKMSQLAPDLVSVSSLILNTLDHLGIEKASFVGVSLGALVIQYFVLYNSKRVDKYVLIGPVGKFWLVHKVLIWLLWFFLPVLPLKSTMRFVSRVIIPYKDMAYGRDMFLACARRIGRMEFRAWCRTLLSFAPHQSVYPQKMGAEPNGLYILGSKDYFFRIMSWFDRKRPQNLVIVKDAGHLCSIDQYKAVNDLIVRFMETGTIQQNTEHAPPADCVSSVS